jgi:hypothetical protein
MYPGLGDWKSNGNDSCGVVVRLPGFDWKQKTTADSLERNDGKKDKGNDRINSVKENFLGVISLSDFLRNGV